MTTTEANRYVTIALLWIGILVIFSGGLIGKARKWIVQSVTQQ